MSESIRRRTFLLGLLLALLAPLTFAASTASPLVGVHPGYEGYVIGDTERATPARVSPGYLLMGGGEWPRGSFEWLAEHAGHGHLVVLRASGADEMQKEVFEVIGGYASVRTLVFHARAPASDPALVEAVRKADAIFIAGGDQANYVRFWKGTPLHAALDAHVRAGKPIGGTSAGLAILGVQYYGALDGGSILSPEALADPLGKAMTVEGDFLHLPMLEHIVTDTHFGKRDRLGRLIAFVANRRQAGLTDLIGLGVDEESAVLVEGDGKARIVSRVDGGAWLVRPSGLPESAVAGQPLTWHGVRVTGINAASRFDLATLSVKSPWFERVADVVNGRLSVREAGESTAAAPR